MYSYEFSITLLTFKGKFTGREENCKWTDIITIAACSLVVKKIENEQIS
jgi:hypothetical protein